MHERMHESEIFPYWATRKPVNIRLGPTLVYILFNVYMDAMLFQWFVTWFSFFLPRSHGFFFSHNVFFRHLFSHAMSFPQKRKSIKMYAAFNSQHFTRRQYQTQFKNIKDTMLLLFFLHRVVYSRMEYGNLWR